MLSRDHADGRATWQPSRGIGSEAYLNGTSQGPTPEDARKDGSIITINRAPKNMGGALWVAMTIFMV
ncbi:MAG: hypothetical protein WBG91_11595 [Syntrophobacteria bacterium]